MTSLDRSRVGVLLLNLGSPRSPQTKDVRAYLDEFLSDPRVIDVPGPVRALLLNLFILPFRPKKSAEAYAKIWTEDGSPLIATTYSMGRALAKQTGLTVEVGMRYGDPSTDSAVDRLREAGVERVLVIPLYPHYAMSSYETAVARAQESFAQRAPGITITFQPPYFDHPRYLDALERVVAPHVADGEFDQVLMSYHGIPERHLRKTDPSGCYCLKYEDCCEREHPAHSVCYRHQCFQTSKHLAKRLGLSKDQYTISFQSRLGRDPWLKPYTDKTLEAMPSQEVKRLVVICPAFIADCLETIEEINMEGREEYLEAGGKAFTYVPCLNDHAAWIDAMAGFCDDYIGAQDVLDGA